MILNRIRKKEVNKRVPMHVLKNLEYGIHTLYYYKEYRTICEAELPYWEYLGFKVTHDGIGWLISLENY